MILKTDREQPKIVVSNPIQIDQPKVETVKEPMTPKEGGGGVITQKQMLYTILAIVVIAVIIVVGVYLYKKYQKSPLTVQPNGN